MVSVYSKVHFYIYIYIYLITTTSDILHTSCLLVHNVQQEEKTYADDECPPPPYHSAMLAALISEVGHTLFGTGPGHQLRILRDCSRARPLLKQLSEISHCEHSNSG